jgi:hypothetical protein
MCIQLGDYIESGCQKQIRMRNKTVQKYQKDAVIKSLYSKLDKGMSAKEFIDQLYTRDYEVLFEQLVEERHNADVEEWNEFESEENSDEEGGNGGDDLSELIFFLTINSQIILIIFI